MIEVFEQRFKFDDNKFRQRLIYETIVLMKQTFPLK